MSVSVPKYPPPDEILADYAYGTASHGVSLLVASHLTDAPDSRLKVREFERVAGVMLADEEASEMAPDALDRVLDRLGAPETDDGGGASPRDGGPLPRPVLDQIGLAFDDIPWRFQLPGVAVHELDSTEDEKVMLMRARPGARIPQHTHEGAEMTLILQGEMLDGGVTYRRGDVAINDESDDHRPQITGDEICYCLIVQRGELRFTGTFSRLLNYLGE